MFEVFIYNILCKNLNKIILNCIQQNPNLHQLIAHKKAEKEKVRKSLLNRERQYSKNSHRKK